MPFFTSPTAFRLSGLFQHSGYDASNRLALVSSTGPDGGSSGIQNYADIITQGSSMPLGHLALLVFEAVLEVVCVSLPGYIIAVQGMFDADAQKFLANLNVQLFTPCLIFTKLASQLTADKLVDLAIIPFIFVTQIAVSFICSILVSKAFKFSKRPRNFVVAMGVFGNSNSLPISLVISLSKTISGLHWDKIPGDNDDEVAARGILYLLIFQQLGQLVRWSWGYHVLLAPPDKYDDEDEYLNGRIETGYKDDSESDSGSDSEDLSQDNTLCDSRTPLLSQSQDNIQKSSSNGQFEPEYASGAATPVTRQPYTDSMSSSNSSQRKNVENVGTSPKGVLRDDPDGHVTSFPEPCPLNREEDEEDTKPNDEESGSKKATSSFQCWRKSAATSLKKGRRKVFSAVPESVRAPMRKITSAIYRVLAGLWDFMNPPLWAMLAAIVVASVPYLQHLFFNPGSFISNSVTRAISQSGGVAVPLILVILGANLAKNTQPDQGPLSPEELKMERNLLVAAIVSRMLLPTLVMAPIIALVAKYVPISILDDPIFVIVCFLLTGAPSALQLAQICQINNVYTGVMSRLLFQSYVIWILPSTLTLVMLALRVVDWAA